MKRVAVFAAAGLALLSLGTAQAETLLAGAKGMALYRFDKDKGGTSACYGDCAAKWPPFMAARGAQMGKGWSTVERKDGTLQWAYQGRPVYYFAGDKTPGQAAGDGMGGVWHALHP